MVVQICSHSEAARFVQVVGARLPQALRLSLAMMSRARHGGAGRVIGLTCCEEATQRGFHGGASALVAAPIQSYQPPILAEETATVGATTK